MTDASEGLSEYEKQRSLNMERNQRELARLGLADDSFMVRKSSTSRPRTPKRSVEPTRRSNRQRGMPSQLHPTLEDRPVSKKPRRRVVSRTFREMIDDGVFDGCSTRAKLRYKLSATQRYDQINQALKDSILARTNGELPTDGHGKYIGVTRIESGGKWHYRATFGKGDYGTFCEAEMAAFVSQCGKLLRISREEVWKRIGIVDLSTEAFETEIEPNQVASSDGALVAPDAFFCAGCSAVIYEHGRPTVLAFGCEHAEGCERWMCWRCAGFSTYEEAEAHVDDDWYCPLHRI